jgi:L-asparaginase II
MQAFEGALVGKVGADGSYAIGVRASQQTERAGAQGALGISVKIEDGNVGVLYAVVAELLALLDIGTPAQRAKLTAFHAPKMLNTMGIQTSRMTFSVALERAT